jgi:photosystem II stability/assembly factor-like uncharacterized protein
LVIIGTLVLPGILAKIRAGNSATPLVVATPQITITPETVLPTPIPTSTAATVPFQWVRINSGHVFARDNIDALILDPVDPDVIYAGTRHAGVYKSIDGGMSWFPSYTGMTRAWIQSLAIDPTNHNVLYASGDGVYKSIDGGTTWQSLMESGGSSDLSIITIDPTDHNHLYYTDGGWLGHSNDGGITWEYTEPPCANRIVSFVIHPLDGNIIFAGTEGDREGCLSGLFISRDGGKNWEMTALKGAVGRYALAIDYVNGNHVYVATSDAIYASHDEGSTWIQSGVAGCRRFVVDPANPDRAFCGVGQDLLMTSDGGKNWSGVERFNGESLIPAIAPLKNDTLYVASQGFFVSNDGGANWSEHSDGLGAHNFDLQMDPLDPKVFFAEDYSIIYQSHDGGSTWTALPTTTGISQLTIDPQTHIFYAHNKYCNLEASYDGGRSWVLVNQYPHYTGYTQLMPIHPTKGILYAAYDWDQAPNLYYSEDQGRTWLSATGMHGVPDARLFFGMDDPDTIYEIGERDFYISVDGGKSWSYCRSLGVWASQSHTRFSIDPTNSDQIFLATRGQGVYASNDGCDSWTIKNSGLGNLYVNTIAIDPNNPNTIYAGTENGAYVSFDKGDHWGEINDGLLGVTVVYSIVIDPAGNVYAGTPYGIFKLEGR